MSLDDDIDLIASAPVFSQLSAEQLRLLAFGAERMTFRSGRTIFRQNDAADCGYVIADGTIHLFVETEQGAKFVKEIGRPSLVGQIALITQTDRSTTAVADTDCALLRINRSLFQRMLREYPETAAAIHGYLRRELETMLADIGKLQSRFAVVRDL
ncbi:MAG: cyclic nucleotide-binding domain-containing protein [Pseudomonadota bacterium]